MSNAWLNPADTDRLRRRLHDIPDLMALVETVGATRLPRSGQSGGGRPTPGSRPPVNLGILDLTDTRPKLYGRRYYIEPGDAAAMDGFAHARREGVMRCLADWVRLAAEEMADEGSDHIPPAETPTITTEAGWLAQHLGWLVGQQWVSELDADVGRIHRDLRAVIHEGRPEYRPRCPDCSAQLVSMVGYWTCPACGRDYRDDRMVMSCQQPMTGERIASLFGIKYGTIRQWDFREELEPATDDQGRPLMDGRKPLYHVADVLRLADAAGLMSERVGT